MSFVRYIFSAKRPVNFRLTVFLIAFILLPLTIFAALSTQTSSGQAQTSGKIIYIDRLQILMPQEAIKVGVRSINRNFAWVGLFQVNASDLNYLQRQSLSSCLLTSYNTVRICSFTAPRNGGLYEFRIYSAGNNRLADSQTFRVSGTLTVTPPPITPRLTPTPSAQCYGKPDGTSCVGGCVNITCQPGNICPACPIYEGTCKNGVCGPKITPTPQYCLQVITWGRDRLTNVCRQFPTSCLPDGWFADRSCQPTPTIGLNCTFNGITYRSGVRFPAGDNCNYCSCMNGNVVCTEMACPL